MTTNPAAAIASAPPALQSAIRFLRTFSGGKGHDNRQQIPCSHAEAFLHIAAAEAEGNPIALAQLTSLIDDSDRPASQQHRAQRATRALQGLDRSRGALNASQLQVTQRVDSPFKTPLITAEDGYRPRFTLTPAGHQIASTLLS